MDYALAIRRNRDQLRTILLTLFALAKMRVGGSLFFLPRSTFAMIMLVLRPAESCVRRLIVIAAHGLSVSCAAGREWRGLPPPCGEGRGGGRERSEPLKNSRAFKLFDPLKNFDPESIWDAEPVWESGFDLPRYSSTLATDDTPLDATHIGQRLNALMRALDTIPPKPAASCDGRPSAMRRSKPANPPACPPCVLAFRPVGGSGKFTKSTMYSASATASPTTGSMRCLIHREIPAFRNQFSKHLPGKHASPDPLYCPADTQQLACHWQFATMP